MSDAKDNRRKHGGDGVVSESQKKARQDQADVTDEEVEEFYAILRRINTAVKYFKSGGDDVASFEKEIMHDVKAATATTTTREEGVQENLSLDLNLAPHSQRHPQ